MKLWEKYFAGTLGFILVLLSWALVYVIPEYYFGQSIAINVLWFNLFGGFLLGFLKGQSHFDGGESIPGYTLFGGLGGGVGTFLVLGVLIIPMFIAYEKKSEPKNE